MEENIAIRLLLRGSRALVIIFSVQTPELSNHKAIIISLHHGSGTTASRRIFADVQQKTKLSGPSTLLAMMRASERREVM
jgi:hypothetical protein